MTREQLQEFKKILEAEQAGTGRTLLQNRQDIGIEKSADVLEEVSYTADSELAMANLSRYSGLLRYPRLSPALGISGTLKEKHRVQTFVDRFGRGRRFGPARFGIGPRG